MKITSLNYDDQTIKGFLSVVMLLFSLGVFAQVSEVFPTIVTTGSKITIRGTGFDSHPTISVNGLDPDNIVYVSDTEITFEVTRTGPTTNRALLVGGTNAARIYYIQPKLMELTTSKSYFVKEIYTNWDRGGGLDFWRSTNYTEATKDTTAPNNKHELLGFKMSDDKIYSTGVNDILLVSNLTAAELLNYQAKVFKAYSTNGVRGKIRSDNLIIAGDMIDGIDGTEVGAENPGQFGTLPEIRDNIKDLTILEAIITGKNGLELGIGVTNFKSDNEIQFFSGNGNSGALTDNGAPDLLITQMADIQLGSGTDIYYYADYLGNVIGEPIKLFMEETVSTRLAKWKVNLYTFPIGVDFGTATPNGRGTEYITNRFRPMRMAAFTLQDFKIDDPLDVERINNINMYAGGMADIAFMAYNQDAFDIKGPVAKTILPQYICRADGSAFATATFILNEGVNVGIEDYSAEGNIREPSETEEYFRYQLRKIGDALPLIPDPLPGPASLTVSAVVPEKTGIYKLTIENNQGSVIVPVELAEGGVPTIWNGATWSSLPYTDVAVADRNLFFSADYNQNELDYDENLDLVGCDCFVAPGVDVTIRKNRKMKLYGAITVAPLVPAIPEVAAEIPAGTFTLKNNASLIQTKEVTENENTGDIVVERNAEAGSVKEYDYIYWSSPVEDARLDSISGQTSHVYKWSPNIVNANGTSGDWESTKSTSGIMEIGRGYIKRVNVISNDYAAFKGRANNGLYIIDLIKSNSTLPLPASENRHMNLIGNPYPSAINADTFLLINAAENDPNASLEGYVQIWTHEKSIFDPSNEGNAFYEDFKYDYGDQYATYNITGSVPKLAFDGIIASGQGFFVQVNKDSPANSPTVSFTNNMRYNGNEDAYDNDGFKRGVVLSDDAVQTEKQLIWLSLVNENNRSSVALVGYAQGATNGKDRLYDANSGSGDMRIYSVLEDSDLLIQGRALPFEDSDKVPLGVEILKNGIYKIGIDHLKGSLMLNEDQGIYLEDTYNNVIHDLRTAPYGFTASAGDIKDRFVLRYTNKTLSVDDKQMSDTFVYIKNQQLYVKASKNIESVMVYDLSGKKLMDYKLDGYSDAFNTQFQFSRGAYLTVIKLENSGTITRKVMN